MPASHLFDKALESVPDATVIVDGSGEIVFASQRVAEVLGYDPAELLGQRVEILLPERLRDRHLTHRGNFARHPQARAMGTQLELTALRKDRLEVPVEISLSPIPDDGHILTAATIRDVTDRKRIMQELKLAREAADHANQVKGRFLATASHDLRQPLQVLALLTGSLRRLANHDPDLVEVVSQQDRAIATMSRLLNALLDISKLESGAIQPAVTDFPLAELFEDLRAEFRGMADNKGLRLQIDAAGLSAHSDPDLVGQILRNLVSNAIKYTPRGEVRLRAAGNGARVKVEISDTGVGIPAKQLPFIYDEFFQVGVTANSNRDGYGLGLSIVRRLVSLLELDLAVESEVGRGTTCILELPRGRIQDRTDAAEPAPMQAADAFAPLVLLVDDDPAVRNATAMLLQVEGCQVLSAGGLDEAVEVARRNPDIDLIVSDYHLGQGETGTDLISAVREVLRRRCAAVLVTGDTSAAMRAQDTPDIRLISKPINADEFMALIRELPRD